MDMDVRFMKYRVETTLVLYIFFEHPCLFMFILFFFLLVKGCKILFGCGLSALGLCELSMFDKDDYYRLILVDDEDEVRGRISSKISEETGFRIVGVASNGYDALELIEERSPHVVVTDIRMPYIDGIELATIIKREYPSIRVAFITGYDEFDYAVEAINLGIRSYLTKPLTKSDITSFLNSLRIELDEEFRRNLDRQKLEDDYYRSIPLLIDSYLAALIANSPGTNPGGIAWLKQHGVELDNNDFILGLVRIEMEDRDALPGEETKLSIRSTIRDLLIRRDYRFHHFLFNEDIIFLIASGGSGLSDQLDEALMEAVQSSRLYHFTRINIGVSSFFRGFSEVRRASVEAERALAESLFLNKGRIAYIDELKGGVPALVPINEEEMYEVEHVIRFGSDEEVVKKIAQVREELASKMKSVADFRLLTFNLLNIAVNFVSAVGDDISEVVGGDIFNLFVRFTNPDEFFDWYFGIVDKIRQRSLQAKLKKSRILLDNAVSYMKINYADPFLSLEKTCDSVGISVSYLSLLFKKNIGQTFVKYLTELRINKAKELLRFSNDRIIEIAEKCGYNDVYYFSHSFKKNVGMPPKRYREEAAGD